MTLDYVGTDVHASFGDYKLNNGRMIRLCPAGPVLRTFVQYLMTFCSPLEAASDAISDMSVGPIVLDKDTTKVNRSGEIPPEAIGGGIFHTFFAVTSDRK